MFGTSASKSQSAGASFEALLTEVAALLLDATATGPATSTADRSLPYSLTAYGKWRHCGSICFSDVSAVDILLLLPYNRPSRYYDELRLEIWDGK